MNSWLDQIDTTRSKSDTWSLMSHQQQAVDSMNTYFELSGNNKEQNVIVVMPTGERVRIVTGCINALVSRVSGTFI